MVDLDKKARERPAVPRHEVGARPAPARFAESHSRAVRLQNSHKLCETLPSRDKVRATSDWRWSESRRLREEEVRATRNRLGIAPAVRVSHSREDLVAPRVPR